MVAVFVTFPKSLCFLTVSPSLLSSLLVDRPIEGVWRQLKDFHVEHTSSSSGCHLCTPQPLLSLPLLPVFLYGICLPSRLLLQAACRQQGEGTSLGGADHASDTHHFLLLRLTFFSMEFPTPPCGDKHSA